MRKILMVTFRAKVPFVKLSSLHFVHYIHFVTSHNDIMAQYGEQISHYALRKGKAITTQSRLLRKITYITQNQGFHLTCVLSRS